MQLLIQTSSGEYEVALADGARVLSTSRTMFEATRSRNMGDHLHACLEGAAADASMITKILVDIGPGGLAATRSGVSFANALSYGLSRPVEGIPFFELLHAHIRKQMEAATLFCVRKGAGNNVFWAEYGAADEGVLRLTALGAFRTHVLSRGPGAVVAGNVGLLDRAGDWPGCTLIPQLSVPMDAFLSARAAPSSALGSLTIVRPLTEHESVATAGGRDIAGEL